MAKQQNNKNKNKNKRGSSKPQNTFKPREEKVKLITYQDGITVGELAQKMNRNASDIIKLLFMLGKMVTINSTMEDELIELVCME